VIYRVVLTEEAEDDLLRLFDLLLERERGRDGGDLSLPQRAIDAIKDGLKLLERFLFTCRKVGQSPFLRELVIAFGHTGYVALFEIIDNKTVAIGAIRHQREDDCH
jgi:plasmid stabilization system protein ParE